MVFTVVVVTPVLGELLAVVVLVVTPVVGSTVGGVVVVVGVCALRDAAHSVSYFASVAGASQAALGRLSTARGSCSRVGAL
jgi:hypothetical protein